MAKPGNEELFRSYSIPHNFIDEGKLFGGMVKTRNFVEGCVLAALFGLPVYLIPWSNIKYALIAGTILIMPAFVLGCVGINGDPVSRFIHYFFTYRKKKRIVSFNNKVKLHERADLDSLSESDLPRDKVLKLLSSLGLKRESANEEEINNVENIVFDDDLEEIKKKEAATKKSLRLTGNTNDQSCEEDYIIDAYDENNSRPSLLRYDDEEEYDADNEYLQIMEEEVPDKMAGNEEKRDLEPDFFEDGVILEGVLVDEHGEPIISSPEVVVKKPTALTPIPKKKQLPDDAWICEDCDTENISKFCMECGKMSPHLGLRKGANTYA